MEYDIIQIEKNYSNMRKLKTFLKQEEMSSLVNYNIILI